MTKLSWVGRLAIGLVALGLLVFLLAFWIPRMFDTTGVIPASAAIMYLTILGSAFCAATGVLLFAVDQLPWRSLIPPVLLIAAGFAVLAERDQGCGAYYGYGSAMLTDCGVFLAMGAGALALTGVIFLIRVMQERRNGARIQRS